MTQSIHTDMILSNIAIADANRYLLVKRFRVDHENSDVVIYLGKKLSTPDGSWKSPEDYSSRIEQFIRETNRELLNANR